MHLSLTAWPSLLNPVGERADVTREALLKWIRAPREATDKASLPGFSLATFKDDRRAKAGVEYVYAVILDIDDGYVTAADLAVIFGRWRGVAFSTFSSTPEAPRWRVILFVTRPMTGAEYARVWLAVRDHGQLRDNDVELDEQTKDASRFWFIPARKPGAPYEVVELDGRDIDVDALLEDVDAAVAAPEPSSSPRASATSRRDAFVAMLAAAWPERGRHLAQRALAGALCRANYPAADALEILCAVCHDAGNEDRPKREATIRDTYERAARGEPIEAWGALAQHVDAGVTYAAKDLILGNSDGRAMLDAVAAERQAPAPSVAQPASDEGLPVVWGRWDEPFVPPPYLVEGLIPEGKVVCFYAEGGSVKTWAALALGISVSIGEPWLGVFAVQKGPALYVDFEDGRVEFQRRKRLLVGGGELPDLGYLYASIALSDERAWIELAKLAVARGLKLLIADALASGMPADADENDPRFAIACKLAGRFTEVTGCTVLFIHHANKSGGLRGSSAIRDQCDVVFKFEPVSETQSTKRMCLVCDKPGPQKKPAPVNLELSDEGLRTFEDTIKTAGMRATTDDEVDVAIEAAVARGDVYSSRDLHKQTGLPKHKIEDRLAALKARRRVLVEAKGRPYWLGAPEAQRERMRLELTRPGAPPCFTSEALEERAHVTRDGIKAAIAARLVAWSSDRGDSVRHLMWIG